MRKVYFLLCLVLHAMSPILTVGSLETDRESGTLIVTYKTDSKGERLKRIRFWLKDEEAGQQNLYPKRTAFVDNPEEPSRMVVIENLPPGRYRLQFLIPNTDRYFQEVPEREVTIAKGDIVKIDQQIKPSAIMRTEEIKPIDKQKVKNENKSASVIPSHSSEKNIKTQMPETSLLKEAEAPKKESLQSKDPGFGKLIVSFDIKSPALREREIKFRIIHANGNASAHPEAGKDTEVPLKNGKMVMVQNVPQGDYRIEFFARGQESSPLHVLSGVHIDAGMTKSYHESITVKEETLNDGHTEEELRHSKMAPEKVGSLSVTANVPTAIFLLRNMENEQSWRGEGRLHTFENLAPGKYHLSFQSSDPFFGPTKAKVLKLKEDENPGVEAIFQTLGRLKLLSNVNEAEAEITDLDKKRSPSRAKIMNGMGMVYLPEGDWRISFKTGEPGRRAPHHLDIRLRALQTKEINAYFDPGGSK